MIRLPKPEKSPEEMLRQLQEELERGISPVERVTGLFTSIDDKLNWLITLIALQLGGVRVNTVVRDRIISQVLREVTNTIENTELRELIKETVEKIEKETRELIEREEVIKETIATDVRIVSHGKDIGHEIWHFLGPLHFGTARTVTVETTMTFLDQLMGIEGSETDHNALYTIIRADRNNTGTIYIGAGIDSEAKFDLIANESISLRLRPGEIPIFADSEGQKVNVIVLTAVHLGGHHYLHEP